MTPPAGTHTVTVEYAQGGGDAYALVQAPSLTPSPIVGSVQFVESPTAYDTDVNLSLAASDSAGHTLVQMHIWGDGPDTGWIPFSSSYGWTLTQGDGSKVANVQFKDDAENLSAQSQASTTLNTTPEYWPPATGAQQSNTGMSRDNVAVAPTTAGQGPAVDNLDCEHFAWQYWGQIANAIMRYGAEMNCTIGYPRSVDLELSRAHVNDPTNFQLLESQSFTCPLLTTTPQYCKVDPSFPVTIDRTEILRVEARWSIEGTDGIVYSASNPGPTLPGSTYAMSDTWVYNSAGRPYPQIVPSRGGGFVLFPGPSYFYCDDDPLLTRPCPKTSNYRSQTIAYYNQQGWPLPPSGVYDAHHIKPSSWGGGNSQSNLVLLDHVTEHPYFTTWWRSFSDGPWP